MHIMNVCIYGFMLLQNFCRNNLPKPTLLSNYEILHYDF